MTGSGRSPNAQADHLRWQSGSCGRLESPLYAQAPLAWLRLEPDGDRFEVCLTTWPGGRHDVVATASPHGQNVRWLGR